MGKHLSMVCCAILILSIPGLHPLKAGTVSKRSDELQGGYFLLHNLADEESSVSMLFLVKTAPEEVEVYGKQVSQTAKDTLDALDKIEDKNPSLHTDQNPLPQIELDVRASIRDEKQHQLLYGTTGPEFIRAFLITQIDASNYALNLTKVLADKETNPHRAQVLRNLSAQWQKAHDNAFRILRDY
jgi:hypothetical protein